MIAGLVEEKQSFEAIMGMNEDEITLSFKSTQMDTHTQWCNSITDGKLQEPIWKEKDTKLAHGDSQSENINEEKHFDEMLKKHNEELELLENLMRGTEFK